MSVKLSNKEINLRILLLQQHWLSTEQARLNFSRGKSRSCPGGAQSPEPPLT